MNGGDQSSPSLPDYPTDSVQLMYSFCSQVLSSGALLGRQLPLGDFLSPR